MEGDQPRIRDATPHDVDAMFDVRGAVNENRASREQLAARGITEDVVRAALESELKAWVAEVDARVIAFSMADTRRGCMWALFVKPAYQRRGLGSRLLERATASLFSQGFRRIFLTTDTSTSAYRFYVNRHWVDVGPTARGDVRFELEVAAWNAQREGRT